jgi:hypothetical protein
VFAFAKKDTWDVGQAQVAHWAMDDNATTSTVVDLCGKHPGVFRDASGNPMTGAHAAVGRVLGALDFDGVDDVMSVPDADALDLGTSFSLSLWVRCDNPATSAALLSKMDRAAPGSGWQLEWRGDTHQWVLTLGGAGQAASAYFFPDTPLAGEWRYVAAVYDGAAPAGERWRLYVNGAAVSPGLTQRDEGGAPEANDLPLLIGAGRSDGAGASFFGGCLDEVRVFKRALTPEEVAGLYNGGAGTEKTSWAQLQPAPNLGSIALKDRDGENNPTPFLYTNETAVWVLLRHARGYVESAHLAEDRGMTINAQDSWRPPLGNWEEGTTLTYTLTPEDGSKTVWAVLSNPAGVTYPPTSATIQLDTTRPKVSLVSETPDPAESRLVSMRIRASEPVRGLRARDIVLGGVGGAVHYFQESSEGYFFSVIAAADGELSVQVPEGAAHDRAGNLSLASQVFRRTVALPPASLRVHLRFEETTGTLAMDSSRHRNNGTLRSGLTFQDSGSSGVQGMGLRFDGADDFVELPVLNLNSNTVTFSAWIMREGNQPDFKGIIFCRDGVTTAGLSFGAHNELRYNWKDAEASYEWDSGLVVPDREWVFAALVVEPEKATLYMSARGELRSAVNRVHHAIEEFGGTTWVGKDHAGRNFQGVMDEARIYSEALSPERIEQLAWRPPLSAPFVRYKLDETSGTLALDSGGNGINGALQNGQDFGSCAVVGVQGGALRFDGVAGNIEIPPLNVGVNRVTMCAWIKREGDQKNWQGIIFNRSGATGSAGMTFGTHNELRYNWNNHPATYNWDPQLEIPEGKWVFAALVVEPDRASLHLIEDGVCSSRQRAQKHEIEAFDTVTRIGRDRPGRGNLPDRVFKGAMDDVRIYDRALSVADLEDIAGRAPRGLRLHLKLDETSGRVAADAAGSGYDGTLEGILSFEGDSRAAVVGNGLVFDGDTGYVTVQKGLNSCEATLSAWIQRDGDQRPWAGLIFNRGETNVGGLNFGTHNELRYHWDADSGASYPWDPGLVVPDKQWVHVALVIEPGQTRMYLTTRDGVTSATQMVGHGRQMPAAETCIGYDKNFNYPGRFFKGMMDDVRMYDRALSAAEVAELASQRPMDVPPPAFVSDPFQARDAVAGWPYRQNLRQFVVSVPRNGYLVFSKLSGPQWLTVAEDGTIAGTVGVENLGLNEFSVRVRDSWGGTAEATLRIQVNPTGATFQVGSATSPAWVEDYLTTTPAQTVSATIAGVGPVRVVMESARRFYVDNASVTADGAPTSNSLGVLLNPAERVSVTLTVINAADGTTASITQVISWTPTELTGKTPPPAGDSVSSAGLSPSSAAGDVVFIRPGDSLLLTAAGTGAASLLEIDANGDGLFEHAGAPGDRFPAFYPTPGGYTAVARIAGQVVGSLRVAVLRVNFDGPIACGLNYRRDKQVFVSPSAAGAGASPYLDRVCFTGADPEALDVRMRDVLTGGLTIKPLVEGRPPLQARLLHADGPVIASQSIDVFTLHTTAEESCVLVEVYPDGSRLVEMALTMEPVIPDLDIRMWVFAPNCTFDDSTTLRELTSSDFEEGRRVYRIIKGPDTKGYGPCHTIKVFQRGVPVK